MNMGKAIRENRLRRNMTQERLASRLNVTAQAVSRWESGQGCPDIALLPELSAVLGVTIDELFACSREQHLERIEAMVEREAMLPREDFDYAMAQAQEGARGGEYRGRCLTLLSDLCMHRSQGYADMAADYARQALEEEPEQTAFTVDYIAECEKSLTSRLGRKVKIVNGKRKGRFELEFYGQDDLQRLLDLLQTLQGV